MSSYKLPLLLCSLFLLTYCSIHITDYGDYDQVSYKLSFEVTPADARLYLDDKFIGYCSEFTPDREPLRIKKRNGFLTIKKEGFIEEEIDLSMLSQRRMLIKLNLRPDPYQKDAVKGEVAQSEKDRAEQPVLPQSREATTPISDNWAEVMLSSNESDVAVWIDGKFWGILSGEKSSLFLEPGKHLIEAFKPGFIRFKQEITVSKEKKEINIQLLKEK